MRSMLARRPGDDRGSAMVMVIGVASVIAILGATLVSLTVFASATSASTRAGIQAQAAAEEAIDSTIAQLHQSAYRGQETTFPCTLPYSTTSGSGTADVTLKLRYRAVGSMDFLCPQPSVVELAETEIVATSTVAIPTGNGESASTRVVKQRLLVQPSGSTQPVFAYGVYSGDNLTTTNNFMVDGGGAHTNGDYVCSDLGTIVGNLTAVGSVELTNGCKVASVHSGGAFKCNSNGTVTGDLVAAGTGTSSFSNTCSVGGKLVTGGKINAPNVLKVGGNLISATGSILVGPSSRVQGYAQAASTISIDGGGSMATVFASGHTPNAPSGIPDAPSPITMPAITWQDVVPLGSPTPQTFGAWTKANAEANNAPSWSVARSGTQCYVERANHSLNGGLVSPVGATVLDARGCDVKLQGISASSPLELVLQDDLTIVARSIEITNGLHVSSTKVGSDAKLRFIVPLPTGAASCSGVATGKIEVKAGGTVFDSNVDTLFYTNGKVDLTNGVSFGGAVYGCSTRFSVNTTIKYKDMTPPGMVNPPSPLYSFSPTVRHDVRN